MKTKGIYFLYRFLQALGLPILALYFLYRGLRNRGYWRSLPHRFGFIPRSYTQTGPGAIWLHAVSVGEVAGCVEFLRLLRAELPRSPIFVSAGTLAGYATAAAKLGEIADGVFFAPIDYVFAVRSVLRALKPSVVAIAETEIWPNLFRETKRTGAGLMLVNGRISDKAFPRYRQFAWFFRGVLPEADLISAQSNEIAYRFDALGAPPERLQVGGSFKYDFDPASVQVAAPVREFLAAVNPGKVWIAASTMPPAQTGDPDEDDAVIDAFHILAARYPDLLLILAPRKPELFNEAARKLSAAGIAHIRRTRIDADPTPPLPCVLLLDSIGELSALFGAADVVFMGGTLAQRGGHNILEPAFYGKPVIVGPHMENFRAIADAFHAGNAAVEIASSAELAGAVGRMLGDQTLAHEIGQRGLECAKASSGASARAAAGLRQLYDSVLPCYRPAMPWFMFAWLLSRLWAWGAARDQVSRLQRQRKVDAPVISVGNLTMGGTGKTPCVLLVAELLTKRGMAPGIVTRGYGRVSPEKLMAVAPGAKVSTVQCGDEPQMFIRSAIAPVGIGGDRYDAAMQLRNRFGANVLVLDDGFQHVQLARDVDIVLIDALNPLGGGGLFPLGRLRERPEALDRADIVVITRVNFTDTAAAVENYVRRYNAQAPVFTARVEPMEWIENRTGRSYALDALPAGHAGAFCGLGNPHSFRHTLKRLGIQLAGWVEYDDHHHYRPKELSFLAHQFSHRGAAVVVTTEKDAVNLCDSADSLFEPLSLFYLKVKLVIENESGFVEEILRRIRLR